MNIFLIGIQGSGKGTLVENLKQHLDFTLISVGQLLREEIATGSELGKKIKANIVYGKLADFNIVIETVDKKLKSNLKDLVIFDGFPRNLEQAEAFERISSVDLVLYLKLTKEQALNRLLNRLTCDSCGYVTTKQENLKTCPQCGGNLVVRADDNEKSIEKRFEIYELETYPLLERYKEKGVLLELDASKTPNEILIDTLKVLKK